MKKIELYTLKKGDEKVPKLYKAYQKAFLTCSITIINNYLQRL